MAFSRRKFVQLSSAATASAIISSLDSFALTNQLDFNMTAGFQLKVLATNWGFDGDMDTYCAKVKKDGYDGIEIWWPTDNKAAQDELFAALKKYQLDVGFLCGGGQSNPQEHLDYFKKMIDAAAKQKIQTPLYINCHSGRDHFGFDINRKFVEHTIALSKETGITICHETHRSRIMFAAHVAREYIQKYPELKLTFDVSHWCNVHESLLTDQKETVDLALERVEHVHARIGHSEGPQVNDPRAPEWDDALKAHFAWWDKVAERKKKNGERMTMLTEFGPPTYMPTLPYTQQPLANQWEINVHMMKLLRKRYA
jgi:sugar phosphate isomerase/epimerase